MKRRQLLLSSVSLAALAAPAVRAQQDRPIRLIVPYAAGGPIDTTARLLAERVRDSLGPVIIENKPGAGGNLGADLVAKAAPDGHTIGIAASATHAINPWLFRHMPYDPVKDFAPITQMVRVPNVLVMNADTAQRLKINSLKDLIAYAKANPGKLTYASTGKGSTLHLAGEAFKYKAGVDLLHVPFTGVPQLIQELSAGRVDLTFAPLLDLYPYISSGAIKALAVGTEKRSEELPDAPTIAATLPGYLSSAWFAVAAPAKTPPELAEKISSEIRAAFQQPDARQAFRNLHAVPILDTAAEVGAVIIVRGNISGFTRTMTTAIALETSKGDLPLAMGLGLILVAIVVAINAAVWGTRVWSERQAG